MEFLRVLADLIASVETAVLIFAVIYGARAIMGKNDAEVKASFFKRALAYLAAFILLEILRTAFF